MKSALALFISNILSVFILVQLPTTRWRYIAENIDFESKENCQKEVGGSISISRNPLPGVTSLDTIFSKND